MLHQVQATIERRGLLRACRHVLTAVSGGADSVAMLVALHKLSRKLGIRLTVAHLNHRIRGKNADRDELFVKRLARGLELRCRTGCADVSRLARQSGESLEMAARKARYAFFRRTASSAGADAVAVAHTADDQVETILLKLARGSGLRGVCGMEYATKIAHLAVIRPLLDVTRRQVVEFLGQEGIGWREDESNTSPDVLRNRVRHEILPLIEARLNPKLREALLRTAEIAREEDRWLDESAHLILDKCRVTPPDVARADGRSADGASGLDCRRLRKASLAARRRVIRLWLTSCGVPAESVDFEAVCAVEELAQRRSGGGAANLPGAWRIWRQHELLLAGKVGRERASKAFRFRINVPGETRLPDLGLRVLIYPARGVIKARAAGPGEYPAQGWLSAAAVAGRVLYARSWRSGDRMKPLGLSGSKKIHDVFVDAKAPREDRLKIPLFECGGEIVWLPGYRVASGWEVRRPSDKSLRIVVARIA